MVNRGHFHTSLNSPENEADIAVIHEHLQFYDDNGANCLLKDEDHAESGGMQQSSITTRRNYIPSPLGTPKRMAQKLGNQLSNCSPMLSRRA